MYTFTWWFLLGTLNLFTLEKVEVLDNFDDVRLEWRIVNDGVMGGLSSSNIRVNDDATATFEGKVTTENNGGFASTRALLQSPIALESAQEIQIRIKGDGLLYDFRVRTNDRWDGVSYSSSFRTQLDEWQTITLPITSFKATFRGRSVPSAPALETTSMNQIGILVGNKQEGPFKLVIDWIKLT